MLSRLLRLGHGLPTVRLCQAIARTGQIVGGPHHRGKTQSMVYGFKISGFCKRFEPQMDSSLRLGAIWAITFILCATLVTSALWH